MRPLLCRVPRQLSFFTVVFLISLISPQSLFAGVAEGQALYESNCARCHKLYERNTGPGLYQAVERWGGDTTKLYAWILNSQAFLKTGDEYANALYAEWDGSVMPAFPQFEQQDLRDLVAWIEAIPAPAVTGPGGGAVAEESGPGVDPTILITLAILLAFIAFIMSRVSFYLRQRVAVDNDEAIPEPVPLMQRPGMRPLFGIGGLVLLSFIGYTTYDGATALGRQENYMPDQPIAFDHQLHAGVNKIDCRYCHVGAEKGKSAVIPSLNVCMNCHYDVKQGRTEQGTTEISKIYRHIGFNPDDNSYSGEEIPVEWVRIHNLPDHVYFNHSQHTVVGGIECQTCHGPVEEMEVLYQHETLSMGWCVNCHRESEVQFTNGFYAGYEELHEQLEAGDIQAVHVEDIGGSECQRCHY